MASASFNQLQIIKQITIKQILTIMRKTLFLCLIAFWAFSTIAAENFKTIKGDGNIVTKEIPISEYTQTENRRQH